MDALFCLDRQLRDREAGSLRESGITSQYLIIRPISPVNPLSPGTMARITGAISTLIDLGMICSRDDTG